MEDLQSTLQSILSDPEQMRRITAMAESLGLKPPGDGTRNEGSGSKNQGAEAVGGGAPTPRRAPMREGTENGENDTRRSGPPDVRFDISLVFL